MGKSKIANPSQWENEIFYEFENLRCIRTEDWKYIHRHPNGPHELYELESDPDEQINLVADPNHSDTTVRLKRRLDAFYDRYAEPRYDLWKGGGSQTVIFNGIGEEIAQADPVDPPPLEKDFKPAAIQLPDGFTAELAAGPPLVQHPMMACFDDRGRLFIAESAGQNMRANELEEKLPNFIRMLEDRDGDGRFDRSTVFADKMTLPQGALWHNGALYVASPPNIWRLEDTDDDGVADRREVLVNQFGYTGNAASIHGCFLCPNGRIYWCDGRHGHEFRDNSGKVTSKREGAYIFSCEPDGSRVEIHCGGGMDNPVEVDFTDEGEILGTVNILYSRPRIDCLVHWLYGGTYPHSERVLSEMKRTGELLGPVHKFGHVAVSGTTRYRSGVLDRSFRDNFFVTIFNTGKVQRLQLERTGSSFRAAGREFLSCSTPDFHPTDVLEAADGTLLVIDTGGWFRIGCPTSQIAKPNVKGGIYRIRRKGMTALADPWGKQIDWQKISDVQLVRLLNDTRFKVREKAIAVCAKRCELGNSIVNALQATLKRSDSRQRRNAVWALTRIHSRDSRAAVRSALSDSSKSVRLAACHSVATNKDDKAQGKLTDLLSDEVPAIRRVAAQALGRIGQSSNVPAIFRALKRNVDRAEEHALIYALIEINSATWVESGLTDEDPRVVRAAIIALDQIDPTRLSMTEAFTLLQTDDERLQASIVEAISHRPEWKAAAAEQLSKWLGKRRTRNSTSGEISARWKSKELLIREVAKRFLGVSEVDTVLARVLKSNASSAEERGLVLSILADTRPQNLSPVLVEPLRTLLSAGNAEQKRQAVAAVSGLKANTFAPQLAAIAKDESQLPTVRVAAMEAGSKQGNHLTDEAFDLLLQLVDPNAEPPAVTQRDFRPSQERARAAQFLSSSTLSSQQLLSLSPLLQSAGPLELRLLIKPFQRNRSKEVATAFLRSLEKSHSLLSLDPVDLSEVIKRYPEELLPQANDVLDKLKRSDQEKKSRLDELFAAIKGGDSDRGRKVFYSEKAKCSSCHRIHEQGGKIGPDLSRIGRIRSKRDLLEAIVFPSATLVREYEPFTLVTVNGRVLSGIVVLENSDGVQIQQATGDPVFVPRDMIEELRPHTISIMPKGLEQALDEKQLADIIAYLQSLK